MKKILVLDDDIEILYVVELILTHHNFIVKTTNRWSVISKTIESFLPDLILMDIDLGGADGGDICKNLKQIKENKEIPIILLSGYNMPDKYVKDSKAQGFLNKPFEPSDLVKLIKQKLN